MTRFTVHARLRCAPIAVVASLSMLLAGVGPVSAAPQAPAAPQTPAPAPHVPSPARRAPLTNLSHLNFLLDTVPLRAVAGHTTYQIADRPAAQAPWTYANKNADGTYTRVGGGTRDAASGHWSQGAFNADDIARTAVVYLRHWRQTGDASSRERAFEVLRSLTYLQTTTGPNAGNVVLWQQPDGTLTPSATPAELPDPSDSAESYWLARTVWALGEGYAAFKSADPQFAAFLQARLKLAVTSLAGQSLAKYGRYDVADGARVPAWLITGGADASAEAVLGLTAYTRAAPDDGAAAGALAKLTEGIAAMSAGSAGQWPFGAILPWNQSRTLWHAWGGMTAAAVADASKQLKRPDLLAAAVRDSAQFTPQLLAAGGPDNAWSPVPGEAQIAYGVDSRIEGLVATAKAADAPGLIDVAAVAAGWYFGANRSGKPAYDPATGTAIDGIETDGRINPNSGAESTIHTLLSMLTLDARPALKAKALGISRTTGTDGLRVAEAESGTVTGGTVVKPASSWTGEANWSAGAYVALNPGGSVVIPVSASQQARNVYAVVNQRPAPSGTASWKARGTVLGSTANGGAGAQGITAAPGILFPFALGRPLPAGATSVTGTTGGDAAIDAVLLQPLVSTVSVAGPAGDSTLYISAAPQSTTRRVPVPRGFHLQQEAFDATGWPVSPAPDRTGEDRSGRITVAPGGFTWVNLVRN